MSPLKKYACFQAGARALAWGTAVATIVVLAWVGNLWPETARSIVAGLLGSVVAMLNDSWEVVAILDRSEDGFPRLSIGRRILHDLFSMAICIGGLVMIWVVNFNNDDDDDNDIVKSEHEQKNALLMTGMWMTLAVGMSRFVFAVWGCADVSREVHRDEVRRRERRDRRHRWPQ